MIAKACHTPVENDLNVEVDHGSTKQLNSKYRVQINLARFASQPISLAHELKKFFYEERWKKNVMFSIRDDLHVYVCNALWIEYDQLWLSA